MTMFEIIDKEDSVSDFETVIKVIGVGGGGGNAVDHMIRGGIKGVEFVATNTDAQALKRSVAPWKLRLGKSGLGAGAKPEAARDAAVGEHERIAEALEGAHMVFITAGMGGGTGSGAAPVVAEAVAALENPPLIVSVVTSPFTWETKRIKVADKVINDLSKFSNCVITVSNAKLQQLAPKGCTMDEAKALANDVLFKAIAGLLEILTVEGEINLDFADVEETLKCKGPALIGVGEATGDDRAQKALRNAIACPLMAQNSIKGAKKILVNVVCDSSVLLEEYQDVCTAATAE
ncbi:MAG: cell division protein FtsZ, partial [Candidatus Accumulibacter sp.]|nr:cell division protein FtsZ [Accumulibacter sp.]